ncbi:MAG TPA: NAD(P)H-quinone oxidoreductase, partial [Polyangia bacterium]
MRAIVIDAPGGPEVLQWRQVPSPEPERGEVRVRVRATAVNRADLLQRMGLYPAPADAPQQIPGLEYAGEIDAVGAGVSAWKPGDRVFGLVGGGAYAEELVTHADCVARMPDALSFTDAAAIPEVFITAWDAMVAQAGLGAGETVLINAVGSGVGTAAVQIARALSARPLGTARTAAKLARASKLGMDRGFTVENGKFADDVLRATGGRGVDVVIELVGGAYVAEDFACMSSQGRIVVVGLMAGARAELDLGLMMRKRL